MDWSIEFDQSHGIIRTSQSGSFSLAEEASFLTDIFRSPDWKNGLPLLMDYSDVIVTSIGYVDVTAVGGFLTTFRPRLGPGKIALLCDDDEKFGLGRQFQIMCEADIGREIRVFRDEAEAIAYLAADKCVHISAS
jgi:hypothetical protein